MQNQATAVSSKKFARTRVFNPAPVESIVRMDINQAANLGMPIDRYIKEGRLIVAPHLATRILADLNYVHQRDIEPPHVKVISYLMQHDMWTQGSQLAFGRLNGELHLMNGQHRLTAVVETGIPVEFQVLIVDVATAEELHELYTRYDTTQRERKGGEVLNALNLPAQWGFSKSFANDVVGAAVVIANGMRRPVYTRDPLLTSCHEFRVQLAEHWWPIAGELKELRKGADSDVSQRLFKAGFLSVMLVTMKYQPAKARVFWKRVMDNSGLVRETPEHTFVKLLTGNSWRGDQDSCVAAAMLAWNAAYAGKKLVQIHPDGCKHRKVLGTPFERS